MMGDCVRCTHCREIIVSRKPLNRTDSIPTVVTCDERDSKRHFLGNVRTGRLVIPIGCMDFMPIAPLKIAIERIREERASK